MNIEELYKKGIEALKNKELDTYYKEAIPTEIFCFDTHNYKVFKQLYAIEILDTTKLSSNSVYCDNYNGQLAYAIIFKDKCVGVATYTYKEEEKYGLKNYFDYYWESKEVFRQILYFLNDTVFDLLFDSKHSLINK
jgi:hypothetical protein